MNNLIIRNHISYFDSRQVAKMIDKRHDNLIRDIENYISILSQSSKLRADNFFKKSSYKAGTGKVYSCYLISKMGCEFIANKMTGDKGILFTAMYVKQFNEMEQIQMQKTTKQWQELRDLSKVKTKFLNDTIKKFVEYAKTQGSKHAQNYYTLFHKLINSITATYDRNNIDMEHLNNILFIISMADRCIHEGIVQQKPYKEIYTICRDRLKTIQIWGALAVSG
ncbi:Rha family transcriptional regulator [Megamonas funiformis]|uniref:Rha family transcriptional regulator n=1 Tax=Megamonas funiformis TaxID=437897 RepID=UPI00241E94F7|nr:Rha family transcriptional regulator [Megamonas funiformis]